MDFAGGTVAPELFDAMSFMSDGDGAAAASSPVSLAAALAAPTDTMDFADTDSGLVDTVESRDS